MTPTTFDLASDATALQAFTEIVTALGWRWEGPEQAKLFGRLDVRQKYEIAWAVEAEAILTLELRPVDGVPRWEITFKIATSASCRSTVETFALIRLLSQLADVGAFVESVLRGRTWGDKDRGW